MLSPLSSVIGGETSLLSKHVRSSGRIIHSETCLVSPRDKACLSNGSIKREWRPFSPSGRKENKQASVGRRKE